MKSNMKAIKILSVILICAIILILYIYNNISNMYYAEQLMLSNVNENSFKAQIGPPFGRSYALLIAIPEQSSISSGGSGTVTISRDSNEKLEFNFNLNNYPDFDKNHISILNYSKDKGIMDLDSVFHGDKNVSISVNFKNKPPEGSRLRLEFLELGKNLKKLHQQSKQGMRTYFRGHTGKTKMLIAYFYILVGVLLLAGVVSLKMSMRHLH